MTKYKGQFVFLEKPENYDSGEYFILEASPNCLYGIKPVAGYGSHDLRQFPIVGSKAWTVVNAYTDDARAKQLAQDMLKFVAEKGPKPNWVESVYSGAKNNADKILSLLVNGDAPVYQSVSEFIKGEVVSLVLTLKNGSEVKFGNK